MYTCLHRFSCVNLQIKHKAMLKQTVMPYTLIYTVFIIYDHSMGSILRQVDFAVKELLQE